MGKNLKGKELGKGISQRSDGRYNARCVINGVKINLYDTNLAQLRKDFETQKAIALRRDLKAIATVTLNEWFKEWFRGCKSPMLKGEVNRHNYNRRMENTFLRLLGMQRLSNLTQFSIQEATNDLTNPENEHHYSARFVREALSSLRECLDSAVVNEMIPYNPCTNINIRTIDISNERVVLSKQQQEMFIEYAQGSYYLEMYKILLSTGMRAGKFASCNGMILILRIIVSMSVGHLHLLIFKARRYWSLLQPKQQMVLEIYLCLTE